jgi:F-box and leucine-rich repeat protein 14
LKASQIGNDRMSFQGAYIANEQRTEVSSMDDILNLRPGVVRLKGINLHDAEILRLTYFPSLEELDLSGCELLTDEAGIELRKLLRLSTLDLSLCSLITDRSVAVLAALPVLCRLSLNWCYAITDAGLVKLAQSASLESVSLWSCEQVTDAGVEALSKLSRLRELELPEFARITDVGLNAVAMHSTHLEVLRFDHLAGISDAGVGALRSLKQLTKLTVQSCQGVTEAGITALQWALPGCQMISSR